MLSILDELEKEQDQVELAIAKYANAQLEPFYSKRREILKQNENLDFWPTVFKHVNVLDDFVSVEDNLILDEIDDFYVEKDSEGDKNLSICMSIRENPFFKAIQFKKQLVWCKDTETQEKDSGFYTSPDRINFEIKKRLPDDSLFHFFGYTTSSKQKERDQNLEIANILADEIFPAAIALFKLSDEDNVTDEYDISDA